MKLNGKDYTKNYLSFQDLMKGAKIDMEMGESPNKQRGIETSDYPYSFTNEE